MAALVTLEQAKKRLRVYISDEDDDILTMIEQASQAVIERVDDTDVTDAWDENDDETIPKSVQAAVLEMVAFLFDRDVTINQRPDNQGKLPARVELLLGRLIKPAMA